MFIYSNLIEVFHSDYSLACKRVSRSRGACSVLMSWALFASTGQANLTGLLQNFFFFLKEIFNFISSFWVILRLSMSVRFPAVPQVCIFLPLSSVSLFELFCSGPPADFRKRGKPRKARVKKTQWVPCICLVMSVIWEVIQVGGQTCIFLLVSHSEYSRRQSWKKTPMYRDGRFCSWWIVTRQITILSIAKVLNC